LFISLAGDWSTINVEIVSPKVAHMLAHHFQATFEARKSAVMVEAAIRQLGITQVRQRQQC